MQPAIFLDRDNTLIHNDGDLGVPEEVRVVDGVPAGLRTLRQAGFRLVVVTNQAGVARGRFSEDDVDSVHQRIAVEVDAAASSKGLIDRFYYCPYHPEATVAEYRRDHPWRKPHPGMILQAARDMGLDLAHSWMIGDQERDILAGRAAGCKTVLVTRDARLAEKCAPTATAASFGQAVEIIVQHGSHSSHHHGASRVNGPTAKSQAGAQTPKTEAQPKLAHPHDGPNPETGVGGGLAAMRRSITELTEEIRNDRLRRFEFTLPRMAAGLLQLLAVLLAVLGLMQMDNFEVFMRWMIGAGLVQLVTMTLLVMDLKA